MLHVFFGSDAFSVREAFTALKRKLNTDGSLETNTVTLSASDVSPEEVMSACDTVPFLGEHRLVAVEGALRGSGRGRKKAQTGEPAGGNGAPPSSSRWTVLTEYVARMPATTELVLLGDEKADETLVKALRSHGDVQRFDAPAQKMVTGWVQKRSKIEGVELARGAAAAIADLVGDDTWAIVNELRKLRDYADGRPLTVQDAREMVSPVRETPPWDLLDPVTEGRGASALKALRRMLDHKPTLVIQAIIQGTYRQLAVALEMIGSGASGREVGERLGLRGYPLDKLLDRASRFTPETVAEAYAAIVRSDSDIKTGMYDDELSLELLVLDLAAASSSGTKAN